MKGIHARTTIYTVLAASVAGLVACAAPSDPDSEKLKVSREVARQLEEKGEVEAARAGTREARDAEVICRRVKPTGSHMSETHCYTRRESGQYRDRLQTEWQETTKKGATDPANAGGPP